MEAELYNKMAQAGAGAFPSQTALSDMPSRANRMIGIEIGHICRIAIVIASVLSVLRHSDCNHNVKQPVAFCTPEVQPY